MKKYIFPIILSMFLFASCSEYQKLLKSTDPELKYDKAVEYFTAKKYTKAITLFDEVSPYYKNTDRSELILNFLAQSYIEKKDYYSASEYYKTYIKSYPRGRYIQEARFGVAYCYYKDSPDVRLDQENTNLAISSFQEFIDLYPENERVKEAIKLLDELNDKLALKGLTNATLYYNLGTYLGRNNYLAAVIEAENTLKKYPATKHREDLMIMILKSKYQQALLSYAETKVDRYQSAIDECYNYINEYPAGKFRKNTDEILKVSENNIK
ncbi:MAG TPA: outer membrane protein assembly factor BamD [Paludibacteraceae bacterium]|nr:outer membrane protein assembly factor BamD [Paludibacteraceae bacterium]HPT43828.1 outer membrane protein assembly factor BamD [Paludibacteraceae bacterium]